MRLKNIVFICVLFFASSCLRDLESATVTEEDKQIAEVNTADHLDSFDNDFSSSTWWYLEENENSYYHASLVNNQLEIDVKGASPTYVAYGMSFSNVKEFKEPVVKFDVSFLANNSYNNDEVNLTVFLRDTKGNVIDTDQFNTQKIVSVSKNSTKTQVIVDYTKGVYSDWDSQGCTPCIIRDNFDFKMIEGVSITVNGGAGLNSSSKPEYNGKMILDNFEVYDKAEVTSVNTCSTISGTWKRTSFLFNGKEDLTVNDCRRETNYVFSSDGTVIYYYYRVYGETEPECVLWETTKRTYVKTDEEIVITGEDDYMKIFVVKGDNLVSSSTEKGDEYITTFTRL